MLEGRTFSLWEGGTRFNTGEAWAAAHLVRGRQRFAAQQFNDALADFQIALRPPANLRAEQPGGAHAAELAYWIGCVNAALDQPEAASQAWRSATATNEPAGNRRGNRIDVLPARYFQALAWQKLGQRDRAEPIFHELVAAGVRALQPADEEANSPSREPANLRLATAHYLTGLGYAGLGEKGKAHTEFSTALTLAPDHLGAKLALALLER